MAAEKSSDQKISKKTLHSPAVALANTFRYQRFEVKSAADFYLNSKLADVHFVHGSDDHKITRVPAHKHLLAVISDVFEKMFYGELKEIGDVTITDSSVAAFKDFLQFFYRHDVCLSKEHVIGFYIWDNVRECVFACVEFLKDNTTDENVCDILTPAIFFEHQELLQICDAHITANTAAVIESIGFLECHREVLARILIMNLLACSEVEVFEACMAWVRAKSGHDVLTKKIVDIHLGDLFNKIPYASMTIQQFCMLAAKYNMVFRRDFHSISNIIAHPETNKYQCQIKWNAPAAIIKSAAEWYNNGVKVILLGIFIIFVCNLLLNMDTMDGTTSIDFE